MSSDFFVVLLWGFLVKTTGRLFFSGYVNILWVSQCYVYMSNVSTCASSTATRRKQVGNISTSIVLVIKLKRNIQTQMFMLNFPQVA